MAKVPNGVENFKRLDSVHERYRQPTDGRTGEREFTFANEKERRKRGYESAASYRKSHDGFVMVHR